MEFKLNNPIITKTQVAQHLGFSDCTIENYNDQIELPSPNSKKTTERKKMSSPDGSVTLKGGSCENEIEVYSGEDNFDKTFKSK